MSGSIINSTPVTAALIAKQIPHRLFCHPGQVDTLEQAARERGQKPDQIVRSILFRLPNNEFVMVLIAGPDQISWPRLRGYLHTSRITVATPEEIKQQTGYTVGAVSPLGFTNPIRILIDQSVLKQNEISMGSGEQNTTVILWVSDLLKALDQYEIGNFSSGD